MPTTLFELSSSDHASSLPREFISLHCKWLVQGVAAPAHQQSIQWTPAGRLAAKLRVGCNSWECCQSISNTSKSAPLQASAATFTATFEAGTHVASANNLPSRNSLISVPALYGACRATREHCADGLNDRRERTTARMEHPASSLDSQVQHPFLATQRIRIYCITQAWVVGSDIVSWCVGGTLPHGRQGRSKVGGGQSEEARGQCLGTSAGCSSNRTTGCMSCDDPGAHLGLLRGGLWAVGLKHVQGRVIADIQARISECKANANTLRKRCCRQCSRQHVPSAQHGQR